MEAAYRWILSAGLVVGFSVVAAKDGSAANARTQNFLVHAPTQALADAVARGAEDYRNELAEYWLGKRLRPWRTPCPIEVVSGPHLAAQGVTTYNRSPVSNFQMRVIGTPERIMDSVLPHEVTHTVLATHFGQPLPRWADEGICTTVEHSAERQKHEAKLREFLRTRRGIAMNQLFLLTEYPSDMLPMYAQGYSVCRFLIQQSGPRRFIEFLTDYIQRPSWTATVRQHYGYDSLAQLQEKWLAWVAAGSGPVESYVSTRARATNAIAANSRIQSSEGTRSMQSLSAPQNRLASSRSRPSSRGQSLASGRNLSGRNAGTAGESGSWYLRRRREQAEGDLAPSDQTAVGQLLASSGGNGAGNSTRKMTDHSTEPGNRSIAPPSVANSGRYSVSQPQPEEQYGQRPSRNAQIYR